MADAFDKVKRLLNDSSVFFRECGEKLAGNLRCRKCSRDESVSAEQASSYLRYGWPKCCGRTMELRLPDKETADA